MNVSRRWLLGALGSMVAVPLYAEAPLRSPRPVPRKSGAASRAVGRPGAPTADSLIAEARLPGRLSFAVFDAKTGEMLEAADPEISQPPASVTKVLTALYALERLGPDHRFSTRLIATGPLAGASISGDLVLVGDGDPTLTSDMLADMAAALRAKGIRAVSGRFAVHAGGVPHISQIDASQPPHVGYNPSISGLNLNFNRVHFEWKRAGGGWQVSMDARGERVLPKVRMAQMRIVDRAAPLFTYTQSDRQENWTVAAPALGNGGSRWLPVRQPALYAAEVFQTLAGSQGVTLPDPLSVAQVPDGVVMAQVASPPMATILRDMLRYSNNLTAEVVGLAASGAGALPGSGASMARWAASRFGISARFVDHSGLGIGSRISAAEMGRVLVAAAPGGALASLMRPFALRDAQGNSRRDARLTVGAKTGTLNFVSALAGYIKTPGGRDLVFAIFASDLARRDALGDQAMERPAGGQEFARRARVLQSRLIERWSLVHEV